MATAIHFIDANIQDEESQLNSTLNILRPLLDYKVITSQEYANIPTENQSIHRILSIEEIVNVISQPDDTENSDDDGLAPSKISISLALSSLNNVSLFIQQENPIL